jgi:hypothetical protein
MAFEITRSTLLTGKIFGNIVTQYHLCHVLRMITFRRDNGSNFDRAITLGCNNGSNKLEAIALLRRGKALCVIVKCNVVLSL